MKTIAFVCLTVFSLGLHAQNIPSVEWQLKTAVLALPTSDQGDATVLGYNQQGKLVTLREGSNAFICLGDDPMKEGI